MPDPRATAGADQLPAWQAQAGIARLIALIAIVCTVVVALAVPLGYFWLSYRAELRQSGDAARLHAAFVTQVIAQARGDWRADIAGLIEADLSPGELPEQRTLVDSAGRQLSASAAPVAWPRLTGRAVLSGPDGPVGEIAVHRSLRPLLLRTAVVFTAGLALGLAIHVSLRVLRRRALERALQAVRREEALAREQVEQHLSTVFDHAIDGIVLCTPGGEVVSVNPAVVRLLGVPAAALVGRPLAELVRPSDQRRGGGMDGADGNGRGGRDGHADGGDGSDGSDVGGVRGAAEAAGLLANGRFEGLAQRRGVDGGPVPVDVTINQTGAGRTATRIALLRDITERKRHEERLSRLAHFDGLTGLPNRSLFAQRLRQALARSRRSGQLLALMFLDLDRFKVINDSLGHGVGDRLLQQVGVLLGGCVRHGEVGAPAGADGADDIERAVYRLGGDEFTVILEALPDAAVAERVASRIIAALERPLQVDRHLLHVGASIGIAVFDGRADDGADGDDSRTDADGLIQQADMAMYRAKQLSRGGVQFFSAELGARAVERQRIEAGLRLALARGEFSLCYQPKADLRSGRVTGVEALLRWNRPQQEPAIGPDRFVPILEEVGLIVPVGNWVLREACRQMVAWQQHDGMRPLDIAVNISPRQFRQPELLEQIAGAVRLSGIDPRRLEIELTESMLVEDSEAVLRITRGVTAMGVRVAIDDFGTGHSSLAYLKRFNVDTLKIDRSFVRDTPGDAEDSAIAIAVIALGHGLNLRVVAEGVETEAQADFLRRQGCDSMQGYLLSAPLASAELPGWLARHDRQLLQAADAVLETA